MSDTPGITIYKSGTVAVVSHVDAFAWRCDVCDWLGTQLVSAEAAVNEAGRHWDSAHPGLPRGTLVMSSAHGGWKVEPEGVQ